jgi:hypothetical protein
MTNGRRWMQATLDKLNQPSPVQPHSGSGAGHPPPEGEGKNEALKSAIIATLAFFALYELPITPKRLHELLLNFSAGLEEVETLLEVLVQDGKIIRAGNLYSINPWNPLSLNVRQTEITKKWNKIDRYFNWLAGLPYVRLVSVINSLAMGTADADSDIDFFVVTENNRLYFVRSLIIVLFRLLGVYKTRQKIKDKFCFGFFVTKDNLNLENLLLAPADPYFLFWLANMRPIVGGQQYWQLMQENSWLSDDFPNFKSMQRLSSVKSPSFFITSLKLLLEILLWIPSAIIEPILQKIHINHTFKLAENNTVTSSTIANAKMLKLHGHDVRAEIAQAYERLLRRSD